MSIEMLPSSPRQEGDLTLRDGVSADNKQSDTATITSHDGPWKTFFKKALTKIGNFMARIFSQQNMQEIVDLYEEKAHDVAIIFMKAGREVYKQVSDSGATSVSVSCDAANTNGGIPSCQKDSGAKDSKDRSRGSHRSKSLVVKFAKAIKVVIRAATHAIRIFGATIIIGVVGAILIVGILAVTVLKAIDLLCELE